MPRVVAATLSSAVLLLLMTVSALAESSGSSTPFSIYDFPNVLESRLPVASDPTVFTDLGAWHGFSLPVDNSSLPEHLLHLGGFPGPYFHGIDWISNCLAQIVVENAATGAAFIPISPSVKLAGYPGMLTQQFRLYDPLHNTASVLVDVRLVFVSARSALIKFSIYNSPVCPVEFRLRLSGDAALSQSPSGEKATISAKADPSTTLFVDNLAYPEAFTTVTLPTFSLSGLDISPANVSYTALLANKTTGDTTFTLQPSETLSFTFAQSLVFNQSEWDAEETALNKVFAQNPDTFVNDTANRWAKDINTVFSHLSASAQSVLAQAQWLCVKAVQTLRTNWRSPAAILYHSALFPSYKDYHGVWAWDSWKHAAALSLFDPALAQEQILALFDYQRTNASEPGFYGMIPDVFVPLNASNINWKNSKPPLATWAVEALLHQPQEQHDHQPPHPHPH